MTWQYDENRALAFFVRKKKPVFTDQVCASNFSIVIYRNPDERLKGLIRQD